MFEVPLLCPLCRTAARADDDGWCCPSCGRRYPVVAGIADFRVAPDPYIGFEEDREKARRLAAAARGLSFAALLDRYYEITPEVPADLAARYRAHHLAGVARGRARLDRLEALGLGALARPGRTLLDLGCGTAGFLLAAARAGIAGVGVDIALRWLVIASRQLDDKEEEPGSTVRLVAACAEALPFPDASFDLVTAENLLEHTSQPHRVLAEACRVCRPGGGFLGRTVNRYALAPEPHVGLWGVGFLPRRAMDPYVRWRRGLPYRHVYPRSLGELRRSLRRGGPRGLEVRRPCLPASDYAHQSPGRRRLFGLYVRLGRWLPPLRPLLSRFGPYLDVVGRP